MEDGDPSVVIPIAGEVHNVFGRSPGTMINTGGTSITANMYTYEIIIELADQTKTEPLFSKDNLDFFICYQYKSMQQRMEVHLYDSGDMEPPLPEPYNRKILIWQVTTHGLSAYLTDSVIR